MMSPSRYPLVNSFGLFEIIDFLAVLNSVHPQEAGL
jgi:hypothetical protein